MWRSALLRYSVTSFLTNPATLANREMRAFRSQRKRCTKGTPFLFAPKYICDKMLSNLYKFTQCHKVHVQQHRHFIPYKYCRLTFQEGDALIDNKESVQNKRTFFSTVGTSWHFIFLQAWQSEACGYTVNHCFAIKRFYIVFYSHYWILYSDYLSLFANF